MLQTARGYRNVGWRGVLQNSMQAVVKSDLRGYRPLLHAAVGQRAQEVGQRAQEGRVQRWSEEKFEDNGLEWYKNQELPRARYSRMPGTSPTTHSSNQSLCNVSPNTRL